MKNENEWPVYCIAFGPLIGGALGLVLSIFYQTVNMTFLLSGGASVGLLIGIILYSIFQNEEKKQD